MTSVLLLGFWLVQALSGQTGAIRGQIVFSDGTAVPAMTVTAIPVAMADTPVGPARTTRTDESGNYQVPNVPAGRYRIRATIATNSFIYVPGVIKEDEAATVVVSPAYTADGGQLVLRDSASGVTVRGRVTFEDSRAQHNDQRVTLTGVGVQNAAIGTEGSFEFIHVRAGFYVISIDAPGVQPLRINVGNQDVRGVELTVPRLMSVTTRVVVPNGIARPQFSLLFEGTTAQIRGAVGSEGIFKTQLPSGTYRIRTTGLPAGYYIKSIVAGQTDALNRQLRIVPSDSYEISVTIGMSHAVKLAGRISSRRDEQAAGFSKIIFAAAAATETLETQVAADGSFRIEKIMPGTYHVRAYFTSSLTSSAAVSIVVPEKDTDKLEIEIPAAKEISGRIAVEGYGPPPKFSFVLVRGGEFEVNSAKGATMPVVAGSAGPSALPLLARNAGPGNQALNVSISALPDGTFKLKLPEGDYRVVASPGTTIPPAYVLKSFTYGSADLLKETLSISDRDSAELQIGFGTASSNPWVKLTGHLAGFDPLAGTYRMALESPTTSTIEVPVSADGAFEFTRVLQRTTYTLRLLPTNDAASAPKVNVVDKDIEGVEVAVPAEREVNGRVDIEGNVAIPDFILTLSAGSSIVTSIVKPDAGGTFKIKLPTDERRLTIGGLPLGYEAKSITYGSVDLVKQPLKIEEVSELRIKLAADPALPSGSLRGRVIGLDPDNGPVRIALNGVTSVSMFEAAVGSNGAFSFSDIPQGSYAISLTESAAGSLATPSVVVITGSDISGFEVTASNPDRRSDRSQVDDPPAGATVADIGAGSRVAANEFAAVAMLRTINTAEVTYLSANGGKFGSMSALIANGLLDSRFADVVSGFHFFLITSGTKFVVAAVPASPDTGRYAFYSTPDGVIRYSTTGFLAPFGQGSRPVQ